MLDFPELSANTDAVVMHVYVEETPRKFNKIYSWVDLCRIEA